MRLLRFLLIPCVVMLVVVNTLVVFAAEGAAHEHTYLTWQGRDTSTNITVNYHVLTPDVESIVHYDTEPRNGDRAAYRFQAKGKAHEFKTPTETRWVHSVELTGLEPGGTYYFVVGARSEEYDREQKFKTLPRDGEPLRFITGGDMGVWPLARRLMEQSAKHSPAFALIGGDLVYENGDLARANWYDKWLNDWDEVMNTPDGFKIPMILGIGNHETNKEHTVPELKAPFYYQYFPQGGKPYFVRDIGVNGVLISLDTDHTVSHAEQVPWLRESLVAVADVPNRFAVYHVPLYPSHRDYEGGGSVAGREAWLPLFDEFKLTTAFENHDHTFKRSKLLRGGKVDAAGTLYLGDGSMGVPPREAKNKDAWYIEKASSTPHFWLVEVRRDGASYAASGEDGVEFERYPAE